jgi:hypothetical protein
MVEAMHDFVFWSTYLAMQKAWFIFVFYNEVTTIDNQSWILTHVYVVERWKRLQILLTLQQVLKGSNADNLTKVIMDYLFTYSDFS